MGRAQDYDQTYRNWVDITLDQQSKNEIRAEIVKEHNPGDIDKYQVVRSGIFQEGACLPLEDHGPAARKEKCEAVINEYGKCRDEWDNILIPEEISDNFHRNSLLFPLLFLFSQCFRIYFNKFTLDLVFPDDISLIMINIQNI
jgi:hypothetical protein